jgi:DNA invertase Pin-like site-specific DNA recombinase
MDIGYARVSTGEQNLGLQLDALRKADCEPILTERASGKAGVERPVREAMLRDLERGDTLTVWKLDRLGRSVIELQAIIADLERRGVKFRCLTQPIDTSISLGWMFFQLLAIFAEFERNLIVERTKAGKAARIAIGLHPGGPRTYGFDVDRATVIEAEASVLLEAATHVLDGGSLARLVDDFNARALPTKAGGRWNETTLRRMLLNPDLVPAILDQQTHDQLAALFGPVHERRRLGRPARHLLSGILVCGAPGCGATMYVAQIRDRDGRTHEVYRCMRSAGGRQEGCGRVSIRKDTVEEFITKAATEAVASEWFADALNARRAAAMEGVGAAELEDARAELADYQALPDRFRTPETEQRQVQLRQRIRIATAKLTAVPELRELLDLPRTRSGWEAAWSAWDVPQRRRRLKLLLRKVTVLPTGKGVRFHSSRLDPDWRV